MAPVDLQVRSENLQPAIAHANDSISDCPITQILEQESLSGAAYAHLQHGEIWLALISLKLYKH